MPIRKTRKARHLRAGVTAIALASAAAVALLPGTAAAQATAIQLDVPRIEFSKTLLNPCDPDESIAYNATQDGTGTLITQPSGQTEFVLNSIFTAKGEGSSGNHYTISQTRTINEMVGANNAPYVSTVTDTWHVIGEGDAEDFLLHTIYHVTVLANGEVTAFIEDISSECR
jgi:hypothetical protein